MTYILNIETATEVCSVAVSNNGQIIFERVEHEGPSHAVKLGVFVSEAMQKIREKKIQLDAVAVSCGPGSYTGLRIGVSEAKGLCYGLGIPMIAVPTLKILASAVAQQREIDDNTLLCPMIDARRMEVYDTLLDAKLNTVRGVEADIIDENSFAEELQKHKIIFLGNGACKCSDTIHSPNAEFLQGIRPLASEMASLAHDMFIQKEFVDSAYFEPFYLKEFVATVAKNKVLPPSK